MGNAPHDGQLTEVPVEGDQRPSFGYSPPQDPVITRIGGPVARPDNVVSGRRELVARSTETQVSSNSLMRRSTSNGSTRSWPTSRRAYTRHARMSSCQRGVTFQTTLVGHRWPASQ